MDIHSRHGLLACEVADTDLALLSPSGVRNRVQAASHQIDLGVHA
jgi:hypothetical protein